MTTSIGPLPSTLINGTPNDATQVMLDLNWIVNQVNSNVFAKVDLNGAGGVGAGNVSWAQSTSYSSGTIGYAISNIFGVPYFSAGGDDGAALQTLANANQSRVISICTPTCNATTTCTINPDGVEVEFNGATWIQGTSNIDSFVMQPTTAGETAAFRNFGGMRNGFISHTGVAASSTQGNGLRMTQCNGYHIENMQFSNADVVIQGGQLGSIRGCRFFASAGSNRGTGSALVHFETATYASTSVQQCFTTSITDWKAGATMLRENLIRVHAGDGVHIGEGYGNGASRSLIGYNFDQNNTYIGSCTLEGAYLDCVNPSTGTPNAVELRSDSFTGSTIFGLIINNCWLGNGTGSGLLVRKNETQALSLVGGAVLNFNSWGVDIQGTTLIDFLAGGMQMQNNGANGSSGDIRLAGGHSFNLGNVTHNNTQNVCVSMTGTWRSGNMVNMNNVSGFCPDFSSSATYTAGLSYAGCQSASSSGTALQSWVGLRAKFPTYSTLSAAQTALGTGTGVVVSIANVLNAT